MRPSPTPIRTSLLLTAALAAAPATPPAMSPAKTPSPAAAVVPPVQDAPLPVNPAEQQADASLAERFEGLAEVTFPAQVPTGADRPFVFGQQAALTTAASQLDRGNARYARNLAEAYEGAGDIDGEVKALTLATYLKPDDEGSWVRRIDLYLEQMQAAPAQLKYLQAVEQSPQVPQNVKAHANTRRATILFNRGQPTAAAAALKPALIENPLCGEALRLQYAMMPANAPVLERAQLLLSLLRANPLQPQYAHELAVLLADAGLVQESLPVFDLAVEVSYAQHRPFPAAALDWAAEVYISGQPVQAYNNVSLLVKAEPDYTAAWYLDLIVGRSGGAAPAQQARDLEQARNAMSNRVAEAVNAVLDAGPAGAASQPAAGRATTRPIESEGAFPLPDVSGAVAVLTRPPPAAGPATQPAAGPAAGPANLDAKRSALVDALANLARLEVYFAHQPVAAEPLLDALRKVLPAGDPLLVQLQGWSDVVAGGRDPQAMQGLLGVALADPLAELGVVQLMARDPQQAAQAPIAGAKLFQDHADGLVGAFIAEGVAGQGVKLTPKATAAFLKQAVQQSPLDAGMAWKQPDRLYTVHVDPVNTGRDFGQPLIALVTLFNHGSTDLTIGEDGFIRPGVLFQIQPALGGGAAAGGAAAGGAAAGGAVGQPAPPPTFTAFDTWAGPLVLRRNNRVQQQVRVDQAQLLVALERTISQLFQIDGYVTTNPDTRLAGETFRFASQFARTSVNLNTADQAKAALTGVGGAAGGAGASGPERITAVGQIQGYVKAMRAVRNVPPNIAQELPTLVEAVHRTSAGDPLPAVAAWAGQAEFALAAAADRPALIRAMAADPDWRHRQMALVLVPFANDPALTKQVVGQLTADLQGSVRAYAVADQGLLDLGKPLVPTPPPAPAAGTPPPAPAAPPQNP